MSVTCRLKHGGEVTVSGSLDGGGRPGYVRLDVFCEHDGFVAYLTPGEGRMVEAALRRARERAVVERKGKKRA